MTQSSEHPAGFRGAEGPGWRLYHGDCLPVLRSLPDGCLDAVITDPPYCSGGWSAAQRRRPPEAKYQESERQPSFAGDQRDQRGFVAWSLLWLEQCYRAMKADRPLLVFIDVMKELPATLVLRPFDSDTLAVVANQLARDERLGEAALPSLAIVLVGLLPVLLLSRSLRTEPA